MTPAAALAWLAAHPAAVVEAVGQVLTAVSVLVAALPRGAQRWPWVGRAVRAVDGG